MQPYSDATAGYRLESEPPVYVRPVELMPAPMAAERVYEQGTIASAIQAMFREADERTAAGYIDQPITEYRREAEMSDPDAFREFLSTVQAKLKESDAVKQLRSAAEQGQEITEHDVEAVFRAYERAIHDTLQRLKSELSPEQLHRLKSAAISELDWSLRDMIAEHVTASAEAETELRYDPSDFFLLLNPKARKIDYMGSGEVLNTLRHSMSRASKDQLKRDLIVVHQYEHLPAVQEVAVDPDFIIMENSIT